MSKPQPKAGILFAILAVSGAVLFFAASALFSERNEDTAHAVLSSGDIECGGSQ